MTERALIVIPALPDILDLLRTNSELGSDISKAPLERSPGSEAQRLAHLEAYLALFAPIRRLPADILLEIFAICNTKAQQKRPDYYDRRWQILILASLAQAPLRSLAQVCKFWQEIIYASPALWSQITLHNSVGPGQPIAFWTDEGERSLRTPELTAADLQLGRRLLSLTLSHVHGAVFDFDATNLPAPWLELLAVDVFRWRHVRLTVNSGSKMLEQLGKVAGHQLRSLESLEINLGHWTDIDIDVRTGCLDFLTGAQQLRKLAVLSGQLVPCIPFDVAQNLRRFICKTESEYLPAVLAILQNLSGTAEVVLVDELVSGSWFNESPLNDLHLPATSSPIERLVLEIEDPDLSKQTLTSLTLPQLLHFQCSYGSSEWRTIYPGNPYEGNEFYDPNEYDTPNFWFRIQFLALAKRSSFRTHLRSLDLAKTFIFLDHLLEILVELDALETLAIAEFTRQPYPHRLVTNALFRALGEADEYGGNSAPKVVPNLRSISMHAILSFDDRVLLAFLQARAEWARKTAGRFYCHMWARPSYWRPLGHTSTTRHVVESVAALCREDLLRLSWTEFDGPVRREGVQEGDEAYV
ncbi:F-box domain-containing protein [Mycena chlorophos]|uniref:F-box domain-containing protein n=1 Tax=Mycena chlorophos TaxID=658473 RepID=A0A8H6SJC1_MYCCL|nr:F-box domain-containing protein [Mycena chlorophos]